MSNYNILQLNAKDLSELKDIATELGLKVSNSAKKETLVYDILDQQAVVNAQRKTITNENQEIERKKRLRVPIKRTPEQKAQQLQQQKKAVKPVDSQVQKAAPKEVVEPKPVIAKPTEVVKSEAKPLDNAMPEAKPAKKANKPRQQKPAKPVIVKPAAETAEKVEVKEVEVVATPIAPPTKVFVLEDRSENESIEETLFVNEVATEQADEELEVVKQAPESGEMKPVKPNINQNNANSNRNKFN